MRSFIASRLGVALATAVALSAFGSVAWATIPDSGGVIRACYLRSGGTLRVIDSGVTNCKPNETALDWNRQGAAGPPGADGADGADGAPGIGPAYSKRVFAGGPLPSTNPAPPLATLDVPAGSYAISALLDARNDGASSDWVASCDLVAGTDEDSRILFVDHATSSSIMSLSLLHTFAEPGQISVVCSDTTSQPARWINLRITAIQVSSITTS